MKTNDLIIAIALLACILTPAYVLYFLKYQLFANQKKHKSVIDGISRDVSKLHSEVDNIILDEAQTRVDRSNEVLSLKEGIKRTESNMQKIKSAIENMVVDVDYIKRSNINDISKANERIDLLKSTYKNNISKLQREHTEEIMNQNEVQKNFNSDVNARINRINKQLDELQSLNVVVQDMYKRMFSKEFAISVTEKSLEVIDGYFKKDIESIVVKEAKETTQGIGIGGKKRGRPRKQQKEVGYVPSEFIDVTQVEVPQHIVEEIDRKEKEEIKVYKPKKYNYKKSRLITAREIEQMFKEKTGLTYYGYVKKYGQEAFMKKRMNAYDAVYYRKYTKNKNK